MSGMTFKLKRIESGVTQRKLAKELGISVRAIQEWEKNIDMASVGRIKRVAEYLNCTVDELIY